MKSTSLYPVFIDLRGKKCAVAGLGAVGCRKLAGLLAAGAEFITVFDILSPEKLSPEAQRLLADARVTFAGRRFSASDAEDCSLVFAATSDPAENRRISELCMAARALCNSATNPEDGSFIVPATARRGGICAAISTSGQSPLLARQWRLELLDWLEPREKMAWLLGRLRRPVLALGDSQSDNYSFFRRMILSQIPEWLESGDLENCERWLKAELPPEIHPELVHIISEYAHVFA